MPSPDTGIRVRNSVRDVLLDAYAVVPYGVSLCGILAILCTGTVPYPGAESCVHAIAQTFRRPYPGVSPSGFCPGIWSMFLPLLLSFLRQDSGACFAFATGLCSLRNFIVFRRVPFPFSWRNVRAALWMSMCCGFSPCLCVSVRRAPRFRSATLMPFASHVPVSGMGAPCIRLTSMTVNGNAAVCWVRPAAGLA